MAGIFAFLCDEKAALCRHGKKEWMRGQSNAKLRENHGVCLKAIHEQSLRAAAGLRTISYAAGMRALPVSSFMRDLTVRSFSTLEALVPTVYSGSSLSVLYPPELRRPLQMQK